MAPYVTAAPVIPINKKDGGVRPIAVGGTLRRLIAKAAMVSVKNKAEKHFAPTQMAFSSGGSEAVVHSTSLFLQLSADRQLPVYILKMDLKNAFNLVPDRRLLTR